MTSAPSDILLICDILFTTDYAKGQESTFYSRVTQVFAKCEYHLEGLCHALDISMAWAR